MKCSHYSRPRREASVTRITRFWVVPAKIEPFSSIGPLQYFVRAGPGRGVCVLGSRECECCWLLSIISYIDVTSVMVQSWSTFGAIGMRVLCNFVLWCPSCASKCSPIDCSPLIAVWHGELLSNWAHHCTWVSDRADSAQCNPLVSCRKRKMNQCAYLHNSNQ